MTFLRFLVARLAEFVRDAAATVSGIVRSYAEIFFLSRAAVGVVLVVGTLLNWRIGAAGLLAVASALAFAKLARVDSRTLQLGYYTYNPLLVGLSLGAKLAWSWPTAVIVCVAGVMTFVLTAAVVHAFRLYLNLPPLSLPFVLGSAVVHAAMLRYSNVPTGGAEPAAWLAADFGLPAAAVGFCRSLGAVVFIPSTAVGGVFALLLLVRSRILFLLAVGGYYLGSLVRGLLLDSAAQSFADVYGFNFILIAMAVGGVFLVPSMTAFALAAAGVCMAMILIDAAQTLGYFFAVPVYTLPFNVVTLGLLYALGVAQFPGLAKFIGATPEETLENDLVRRRRFREHGRTLSLPFLGRWTVWQAFDDEWTHQGAWSHAYDFVITGEDGETYDGDGAEPDDYHCFRKPVIAPCRGKVVKVVDHLPDNPIGRVDKSNNWGNHVVLLDDRGFYVELSHFAQHSIRVQVGERVEPGRPLGLCGNSGYSPQPHLHVHVQAAEAVGSPTLPFSFVRYFEDGCFRSNDLPQKHAAVESAVTDENLDAATDFLLRDVVEFDAVKSGRPAARLTLTVRMASDGTLYFESNRGARLYFGKHDGTFYFYRLDGRDEFATALYLTLPRLPLVRHRRASWTDVVPVGRVERGLRRWAAQCLAPLVGRFGAVETEHRYAAPRVVETTLRSPLGGGRRTGRVEFAPTGEVSRVVFGDVELRRRTDVATTEPAAARPHVAQPQTFSVVASVPAANDSLLAPGRI